MLSFIHSVTIPSLTLEEAESNIVLQRRYIATVNVAHELAPSRTSLHIKFVVKVYPHKTVLVSVFPEYSSKYVRSALVASLAQEQTQMLEKKKQKEKLQSTELIQATREGALGKIQRLLEEGHDPNKEDAQKCTALMIAAAKGRSDIMSLLIEYGAEYLNTGDGYRADGQGCTILEYALKSGNESAVLLLLHPFKPHLINQVVKDGQTPLIISIKKLSVDNVRLLLAFGANANQTDQHGFTPLTHAVNTHCTKQKEKELHYIISLLVHYGAHIDAQNMLSTRQRGYTALMCAVEQDSGWLVERLLELGADTTLQNSKGHTAESIARNKNHKEAGQALDSFKEKKERWLKEHSATELMYAAHTNNTASVAKLLKDIHHKNTVNYKTSQGECALLFAANHNNLAATQALLAAGADPRIKCYGVLSVHAFVKNCSHIIPEIQEAIEDTYNELTLPAKEAAQRKTAQKQRIIDQAKIEIAHDSLSSKTLEALKRIMPVILDDCSPALYAIKFSSLEALGILCKHGLLIPEENLLEYSLTQNRSNVLEVLLTHNYPYKAHLSSLFSHIASSETSNKTASDIVQLLRGYPPFWQACLEDAIKNNRVEQCKTLCTQAGALLDNEQLANCLQLAVKLGRTECVQHCITAYPQSCEITDKHGRTALLQAAVEQQVEIFRLLCSRGARLDVQDKDGCTVTHLIPPKAVKSQELLSIYHDALQAIKRKQDMNGRMQREALLDAQGWTPVMKAVLANDAAALAHAPLTELTQTANGTTPLILAVTRNKEQALDALVQRLENELEQKDPEGRTALFRAAEGNNGAFCNKLMEKNASLFTADISGKIIFELDLSPEVRKILHSRIVTNVVAEFLQSDIAKNSIISRVLACNTFEDEQLIRLVSYFMREREKHPSFSDILKEAPSLCLQLKRAIETLCQQICFAATPGEAPRALPKQAKLFLTSINVMGVRLLIRNKILTPEYLLFTLIAAVPVTTGYEYENKDIPPLIHVLIEQAGPSINECSLPSSLKNFVSMLQFCRLKNKQWYVDSVKRRPATHANKLLINPVIWAWLVDNKAALFILLKIEHIDFNVIMLPDPFHLWEYLLQSYAHDMTLIRLVIARQKRMAVCPIPDSKQIVTQKDTLQEAVTLYNEARQNTVQSVELHKKALAKFMNVYFGTKKEELEHVSAAVYLGRLLCACPGIPRNYVAAQVFFQEAIESHHHLIRLDAQAHLAQTWAQGGYGIQQDLP